MAGKIWVGNLPPGVSSTEVFWMLLTTGKVIDKDLATVTVYHREHDSSAHIFSESEEGSSRLKSLNGFKLFDGLVLDVRDARPPRTKVILKHFGFLAYTCEYHIHFVAYTPVY